MLVTAGLRVLRPAGSWFHCGWVVGHVPSLAPRLAKAGVFRALPCFGERFGCSVLRRSVHLAESTNLWVTLGLCLAGILKKGFSIRYFMHQRKEVVQTGSLRQQQHNIKGGWLNLRFFRQGSCKSKGKNHSL